MVFDNDTQGVGMRTLLAGHGMKLPAFTARDIEMGKSCELFSRFFCQITVCIFLGIKFLYRCIVFSRYITTLESVINVGLLLFILGFFIFLVPNQQVRGER